MKILKLILLEFPIILACLVLADFIYLAAQKEQWTIAGVLALVFILVVSPKIKNFKVNKDSLEVNQDEPNK